MSQSVNEGLAVGDLDLDPVEITYNGEVIASLDDETTSCILKTGGKRCAYDINVRYAAPTPASVNIPVYKMTSYEASPVLTDKVLTGSPGNCATLDITDLATDYYPFLFNTLNNNFAGEWFSKNM